MIADLLYLLLTLVAFFGIAWAGHFIANIVDRRAGVETRAESGATSRLEH